MACLLLAIQQFGFAHALSHLASPSENTSRNDKQHPAGKICIECVAFAQIDSGLTGAVSAVPSPAATFADAALHAWAFSPAFLPAFRSRAPPVPR